MRVPELADAPPLAPALVYLWRWFDELQQARQHNGFAGMPLSFAEIRAWRKETGTPRFKPYELEVIKIWDDLSLAHAGEQQQEAAPKPKQPKAS